MIERLRYVYSESVSFLPFGYEPSRFHRKTYICTFIWLHLALPSGPKPPGVQVDTFLSRGLQIGQTPWFQNSAQRVYLTGHP